MAIKKRFSIAPDLASGIRNTMQSASTNQGQLHYDMMALETILPDPQNPRKLKLTSIEILNGLSPTDADPVKQKEYLALLDLSESIKRIGIRNALEVYKEGAQYRIISGERRYWAARIAGQKMVPVRVSQKPDEFNLRYTQWVENINRQDLTLWEKYINLIAMRDAYTRTNTKDFDPSVLEELLGISSMQAYRYAALLRAEESIIQLIKMGKLNNLKVIQELVTMKDKGARNQMISWILSAKGEVTSLIQYRNQAGKKNMQVRKQQILPLKISYPHTARQLFTILLTDDRFTKFRKKYQDLDWSSSKEIGKAFKNLFKVLETEYSAE